MTEIYVVHYNNKRGGGLYAEHGRQQIIRAIMGGHVDGSIERVECYDEQEGWSRDVTEDMARDVARAVADDGDPPSTQVRDFIEEQLGVGTALPAAA